MTEEASNCSNNKGINFLLEENYQEALNSFSKAISENPKNDLAYFNRAVTFEEIGEHKNALSNYDQTIKLNNKFEKAFYNRGLLYYKKKKFNKSLIDFSNAI